MGNLAKNFDKQTLIENIFDTIKTIKDLENQIYDKTQTIAYNQKQQELIKMEIVLIVSNELTEQGKPKFSNEQSRKAEIETRLIYHDKYQQIENDNIAFQRELFELQISKDYYHRMYQAIKAILLSNNKEI